MAELNRAALVRAYRAGQRAGAAGFLVTSCPYHDPYTVLGRALIRFWVRGWRAGARNTPT